MAEGWEMLSGKFAVVATLMRKLREETTDRIVIVSNYTQTLDLFQTLCRTRNVRSLNSNASIFSCSAALECFLRSSMDDTYGHGLLRKVHVISILYLLQRASRTLKLLSRASLPHQSRACSLGS